MISNNEIVLSGKCVGETEYSHSVKNEDFYKCFFEVKRLSERTDTVSLTFNKAFADVLETDKFYTVKGQLRTYNRFFQNKTCLVLTVFVKEATPCHSSVSQNEIKLNGFVCKEPVYRVTPFKRQICDVLLAVNRGFNKSDYIPCITWGSNAFFTSGIGVGTNVAIKGRLQSREYEKINDRGEKEIKTAYEVSVSSVEIKNEIKNQEKNKQG